MGKRAHKALIFDFDGLIVDTETPHYESWQLTFRDHGHELELETYVDCVGSTAQRFDPLDHLELLLGEAVDRVLLEERHRERVTQALATADALPGVRERLAEAREAGILLAVASSSSSLWVDDWLGRLNLVESFAVIRTRDKVKAVKPDPELFLSAAEHLGVAPEDTIVFEDSHHGLKAALAARMRCVVVPNRITSASDFTGAALRLQSLAEASLQGILARLTD